MYEKSTLKSRFELSENSTCAVATIKNGNIDIGIRRMLLNEIETKIVCASSMFSGFTRTYVINMQNVTCFKSKNLISKIK